MAGFGEEVGDAYIEVHADSRPFRREIRRDARRAGRAAAGEFDEGFQSQLGDTFTKAGKGLEKRMRKRGDGLGQDFSDGFESAVKGRLKRFNRSLGDSIATGDWSGVFRNFDNMSTAVDRTERRLKTLREQGRLSRQEWEEARKSLAGYIRSLSNAELNRQTEAHRKELKRVGEGWRKVADEAEAQNKRITASNAKHHTRREKDRLDFDAKMEKANRKAERDEKDALERRLVAHRKFQADVMEERRQFWLDEFDRLKKADRHWKKFEGRREDAVNRLRVLMRKKVGNLDIIDSKALEAAFRDVQFQSGKMYRNLTSADRDYHRGFLGRLSSSRSELLHVIGIIGGAFERGFGKLVGGTMDMALKGINAVGDKLVDVDGILGKFGGKLASLGSGGGAAGLLGKAGGPVGIIVAIAAAVAGLLALNAPLGILVSAVSSLTGVIVALASTISFALIGALGSLLPILGALTFAVGGLVLAFIGFEDLNKVIKPLIDFPVKFQESIEDSFYPAVTGMLESLTGALESFFPLFEALITEVVEWGESFADLINSKEFQLLLDQMGKYLPDIMEELGGIFNAAFLAISAVISAASPVVESFLAVIGNALGAWAEWAASPEGQKEIQQFFKDAAESAIILWGVLSGVIDVLSALFSAGKETGDDLFAGLSQALHDFADWLRTPEGRKELEEWFQRAKEFAAKLVEVLDQLAKWFEELDTENAFNNLKTVFDLIKGFVGFMAWGADQLDRFQTAWNGLFDDIEQTAQELGAVFAVIMITLFKWYLWFRESFVVPVQKAIKSLENSFRNFRAGVETQLNKVRDKWNEIKESLSVIWKWIDTNILQPFKQGHANLATAVNTARTRIGTYWEGMKLTINTAENWIRKHALDPLVDGINGVKTAFGNLGTAASIAWGKVKTAASGPVSFVINTVYNDGIRKVFNGLAKSVGLDWRLPEIRWSGGGGNRGGGSGRPNVARASGGTLPGYTPGRDVHDFYSPTAGWLHLSGGEGIMRPEFVRAVGGAKGVDMLNRAAKTGRAFASGGVFGGTHHSFKGGGLLDDIRGWAGDVISSNSTLRSIASYAKTGADLAANFLRDPKKGFAMLITAPMNAALRSIGGGDWGRLLSKIPPIIVEGIIDKALPDIRQKREEAEAKSATESGPFPGRWKAMFAAVKKQFPDVILHSAFRAGAITAIGTKSMHSLGRAIDISPRMDIFEWLHQNYPGSRELIFSPAGMRQIYKGRPFFYPEPTRGDHWDHIHWAMQQGGIWGSDSSPVNPTAGLPALGSLPVTRTGGMFSGAQARIIAEAGREAVVPLDQPLNQVDPAVRGLADFAQHGPRSVRLDENSVRELTAALITAARLVASGALIQQGRSAASVPVSRGTEW